MAVTQRFQIGASNQSDDNASSWLGGINAQAGTSYTIVPSDSGKLITSGNGSAVGFTLPQAGTLGFEAGRVFRLYTVGAGTVTVTPTTSTINGAATKTYAQGAGGTIISDGTNYIAI